METGSAGRAVPGDTGPSTPQAEGRSWAWGDDSLHEGRGPEQGGHKWRGAGGRAEGSGPGRALWIHAPALSNPQAPSQGEEPYLLQQELEEPHLAPGPRVDSLFISPSEELLLTRL